jgi:hypothetical protein
MHSSPPSSCDAEVNRDACLVRPHHGGRLIGVTDEIATGTGFVFHDASIKLLQLLNSGSLSDLGSRSEGKAF